MPHKFSVNHQLRLRLIWSSVVHGSRGVVLAVPLDLAITPMRVLQDSLIGPDCGAMLEEGEVDDKFLMILFLVVERLSEKNSSWKPRVRTANSVLYTSLSPGPSLAAEYVQYVYTRYLDMLPTTFWEPTLVY
ncbi:unnamed protein product [Linum tenue]|uniref:Uncharacterized protein n=1 Tax=Linum tenue TaxID=586396 RepID=A0AAV0RBP7_9ROSI|nr:unnamed protein product [Linum tenue]